MRERDIFIEALETTDLTERRAILDKACEGDAALRGRVEQLLVEHLRQESFFLDRPLSGVEATIDPPDAERPGAVIGPYKLLQQIGEGGMGAVFMAEQSEPILRTVALKIIKPGMDTRQVIARFEAERQALAMMDHPNIAKVLDAGTTNSGRPYFVMELVKGVPLTKYCDEKQLPLRERLELLLPVCQAVQHAHQKGIIHRDLKPTNILVAEYDNRSVPKVIDFGVAKATAQRLTERTMFTEFGQVIGTFEYMSPEQAKFNQLDIDTRSDIYSLGVLLYELLTGSPPFERNRLQQAAIEEVLRIIREEEPPKPSTRLSTSDAIPSIAANRHIEPGQLSKAVRGELDWIVMKCLEKDRNRRYESASALATDILHYLADEPVTAAAPSRMYRIRKFVGRNKLMVVATSTVLAALLVGAIGTTIGMIGQSRMRAEAERQSTEAQRKTAEAELAKEQLQAINSFLTRDVLAFSGPNRQPDKATADQILKIMIDPAAATVGERFKDKPLVEAEVRHALAATYHSFGRSDLALPQAQQMYEIYCRVLGNDHSQTLIAADAYAYVLRSLGRLAEAEPLLRQTVAGHRRDLGNDHIDTVFSINSLATLLHMQGKPREAEPLFREALDASRRGGGADNYYTIELLNNLALCLRDLEKFDEAEPLIREALSRSRRVLGDDQPESIRAMHNLAVVLESQQKAAEAEPLRREAMERSRRMLGDDHPQAMHTISGLGRHLLDQGKLAVAEPLLRDVLERRKRVLGDDHPDTLNSLGDVGELLQSQRKFDEAEPIFRERLEALKRDLGNDHLKTGSARMLLASALTALERYAEAEKLLLEAERILGNGQDEHRQRHQNCIKALLKLYEAWDESEPGKNHQASADQWRSKLLSPPQDKSKPEPTTKPASSE